MEAVVVEDVSQVGVWWGGTVSEIHKPQVWIERADIERARPILTEYDRRTAERRAAEQETAELACPITVTCDKCGKLSEFPASLKGTVQRCPRCSAYFDINDGEEMDGWDESSPEETDAT